MMAYLRPNFSFHTLIEFSAICMDERYSRAQLLFTFFGQMPPRNTRRTVVHWKPVSGTSPDGRPPHHSLESRRTLMVSLSRRCGNWIRLWVKMPGFDACLRYLAY